MEADSFLEQPEPEATAFLPSRVILSIALAGLAAVLGAGFAWKQSLHHPQSSWPEQAEIMKKMLLYQKVRQLSSLSDDELRKHQVDVVALPPVGPAFWEQKESELIARNLGFKKSYSDGVLTITRESSNDIFVRVSKCLCDVSLIALKMMSALLSLEASIHVCNLPDSEVSTPETEEYEKVWTGNRRLRSANLTDPRASSARRLAFNVPSASNEKQDVQEAQMSCAGQINGMLSSFVAVSQYVSDSIYTCPPPNEVLSDYPARCSMGVSVLVSGVEKSAAALSDIAVECRDPTTGLVPYSKAVKPGRSRVVLAACLNNIGQAIAYLCKIFYQLNDLATGPGVCPKYPTKYERYVCTENIGSLLADLGQLNTYLFGAASGCGETTLVPFACASRIAATITGLFDVVQGVGATLAWCNPPGYIAKNISARMSHFAEKVDKAKYQHKIKLFKKP